MARLSDTRREDALLLALLTGSATAPRCATEVADERRTARAVDALLRFCSSDPAVCEAVDATAAMAKWRRAERDELG